MGIEKKIIKYFIAGALGGFLGSLIFSFLPIPYLYMIPYFSITSGVGVLILGLILEFIIKD